MIVSKLKSILKPEPDYSSIEYLRSRGVSIGENAPIYDTLWSEKTEEQKQQMIEDLKNGGVGYDK